MENGLRVYFSVVLGENEKVFLVLIGGNKNSQPQDIRLAKKLLLKIKDKD